MECGEFLTTYSRIRGAGCDPASHQKHLGDYFKVTDFKPLPQPAATKTLGDMTLEPVFFCNLLKSILVHLSHYLTMRTSKQCELFLRK